MKWLDKLIVSERGLWDNPNEPVVVPTKSGNITMKADPKTGKEIEGPVFAIDNTGYSQMMYPGGEYQFPGNMVYEVPMAQYGKQVKKSIVSAEELPEDTFPYEGTSAMFKDERYNTARAKELYEEDESGHLPSIDYETGEWLKAKRYPTSWKEYLQYALNPEVNKLGFPTENKEGFLKYPNYANGGDISIPDLSRPNWLDKAQKGQQVKYYDDYSEYLKAAKAEADSSSAYQRDKKAYESVMNVTAGSTFPYEEILKLVDSNEQFHGNRTPGYSPKPKVKPKLDQQAVMQKIFKSYPGYSIKFENDKIFIREPETEAEMDSGVRKLWKPLPIEKKKDKPKEYIPTKTPKLEREPLQLVMPQSDRTLMPYNNTLQVVRGIQKEDRSNENLYPTRVVPAPTFKDGGWLEQYQEGSQVKANLPWINQSGQYKDPTGVGPTVGKAEELKQKKLVEAARNSPSGKLPSGAITPVMGPVEYALMGPAAASTIRAAAPIVGSALNTSIGLPGATAGNALGAMGAADALVNRFPQIPGQLSRGEYLDAAINAGTGVLDLYGANMVSPLFKGAKASKAATSTKTGYDLRDIKNATKGLGSTDDEAIAAIEAIRSRKLSSWKTPEGRRRLQKLIDETPLSFRANHPLKNETPDTFIKRMEDLVNLNVGVKNIKEELPKVREQIMGYHKNMNEIDEAFNNNRISADDYFNMQADLDDKLQRLSSKHDELYLNTNSNYSAFLEADPYKQKAFINPELLASADLFPVAAHEVSGHSLSSFGKGSIPTYLDEQLGGLRLKNAKDETIDAVTGLKPKGESNLFYHANYPGSLSHNQDYWLSGSSGTERVPFVTEVKEDMFTKGIIKNDYDVITPEMLEQHYNTYVNKAGEKYPLRVYDIMKEDPENFNLLSKVLNNLPSAAAPLTIAAGTAAAMKKEKNGRWLDKYQVGSEVNCPDGNCRETDQIQAIYDNAQRIPERVADFELGVAENLWFDPSTKKEKKYLVIGKEGDDAREIWKQHGVDNFVAPSCMYTAGLGWRCAPETKDYMSNFNPTSFNSNTGFIDAVNKGTLPFNRVIESNQSDFDSQKAGNLKPGDIVNFKGPGVSHGMTFTGYDEKGNSKWFHSPGSPSVVDIQTNLWKDLRSPEVKKYINRFDVDRYVQEIYNNKIQELEKQARENPTYYKKGGVIPTDNQDYNYIKYKDLSLSRGTGWLDNYK